jgi:tetratricopeptide (TPR) repeat protein
MAGATPNSAGGNGGSRAVPSPVVTRRFRRLTVGETWRALPKCIGLRLLHPTLTTVPLLMACLGTTGTIIGAEASPRAVAEQVYKEKAKRYQEHSRDVEAAWQFGRASFDLGELATNNAERAEIADRAIAACQQALTTDRKCAPAHYYLALNLGELARTKSMGALKLVAQMEGELITASELDKNFDFGGPDRSLGLLYRDAPSFISIGSRSKARQHLQRAIELASDYPENRLDLIESCLKWGDRTEARRELAALEAIWPKAREKLRGPEWSNSWTEWSAQLEEFKRKVEESSKLETPRH